MKKILATLTVSGIALAAGSMVQAQEVHLIMCGGEIREADQTVITEFEADKLGVTVDAEPVPWGTCQGHTQNFDCCG